MKTRLAIGILACMGVYSLPAQIQLQDLVVEAEEAADAALDDERIEGPRGGDHGTPPAPVSETLTFLNGDFLTGELISADAAGGVTWRHPHAKDPIRFGLEALQEVALKGPFPTRELEGLSRVRLSNGDEYRGRILSMDRETLRLESPYAGEISLAVPMIVSLQPRATASGIYEGPNNREEWTSSRGGKNTQWKFLKNALYYDGSSNESLGREIEDLPDQAEIAFDLAWRGNVQFYVMLWADDPKKVKDHYQIMLQHGYVRCYRHSNDHGRNDLGNTQFRSLRSLADARVRLLLNREAKEITLLINGELVKKWTDHFDGEISGDSLVFRSQGNTPMKIENLVVRQWDGSLDEENGKSAGERDLLVLGNGDLFSGQVVDIVNEVMRFKTDFAELPVPLDRIAALELAMEERAEPRRRAEDVQLVFPTEERITLALNSWKNGRFQGRSETTGDINLETRFVSQLILNPYDERRDSDDEAW